MKVRVIVNPSAGGKMASASWPEVKRSLEILKPEIVFTESARHAEELARNSVRDSIDFLVAVGGDGTINEVIQGIVLTDTALVPVSAGTGSDFARSLGSPNVSELVDFIRAGRIRRIDTALAINNTSFRYFANILEIGFGSVVMQYVNSHARTRNSFNRGVLMALGRLRSYDLKLESQDFTGNVRTIEIVVANGRYFGGGMLASPESSMIDGLLDVHVVSGLGRLRLLTKLNSLKTGTYVSDPVVRTFKCSKLIITGNAPQEADGENMGSTPVEIRCVPSSLNVVAGDVI